MSAAEPPGLAALVLRPVLVIGHVSSCGAATEIARKTWPHAAAQDEIHALAYGRASDGLPDLAGLRVLSVPSLDGSRVRALARIVRFLGDLRGRYPLAAVAQPSLSHSRIRGLLLAFPFLIGARRVVMIEPDRGHVIGEVSRAQAFADLARWLWLHAASALLAMGARWLLAAAPRNPRAARNGIPSGGRALYLRTDLDLMGTRLEAGGSAAHTEGIVRAIAHRGHELELWSTGEITGLPSDVPQHRLPGWLPANTPTEIGELISGLLQVRALWRNKPPTAFVYQRYSFNNLAGVILSRHWRVPLVLEANCSEVRWRRSWAVSPLVFPALAETCERFILGSADTICTVSAYAAEDLRRAGAREEGLIVAPNAVDVDRFADAEPIPLDFPEDAFVIAFAGLFYPWHGARHLAAGFGRLHARHPNARLVLVGDGEERPLVETILEKHQARDATVMPGIVPRASVPRYLAAADVVVSPHANVDRFPGSPMKIFEYMACGRAIIASRLAQIGEILRDEETALLVPPGDEAALLAALERLYADPALRRSLGANAQAEARLQHSWAARVELILDGAA